MINQRDKEMFDRQIRQGLEYWDQQVIKNQRVLILGAGGLGSIVGIQLIRMGVGKLTFIDYDTVDISNLPRQHLYGVKDIDKNKIESLKENIQFHNIGDTVVEAYNVDAIKQWGRIVELAKQHDAIFNLIDYGDYFDISVCSLCVRLRIPLILGGNYFDQISADYYPPVGMPCFKCLYDGGDKEIISRITPYDICNLTDLSFLPKNDNPTSVSSPNLCTMTGVILSNFYKMQLFNKVFRSKTKRVIFYLSNLQCEEWPDNIVRDLDCVICREPTSSHQVESSIIDYPLDKIWAELKFLRFQNLFPDYVESTHIDANNLVVVKYKDQAVWKLRILETIGTNQKNSISYELVSSEPQATVASQLHTISLIEVSETQQTYIDWQTEYSNDVNSNVIQDAKYKKRENFRSLKSLVKHYQLKKEFVHLALNTESAIIDAPYNEIKRELIKFNLQNIFPSQISSIVIKKWPFATINHQDKAVWQVQVLEQCESSDSGSFHISYQVVHATPKLSVASIIHKIEVTRVTDAINQCFLSWETEFSNDVTLPVLQDNKYKKLEQLKNLKNRYSNKRYLIPQTSLQTVSGVINTTVQQLWPTLSKLQFEALFPDLVESSGYENGQGSQISSVLVVKFKDQSVWKYRILEVSSSHTYVTYEVISQNPVGQCFSAVHKISIQPVTDTKQTYLEWETEFSNDANANIIQDNKFKKLDNLNSLKKLYSANQN